MLPSDNPEICILIWYDYIRNYYIKSTDLHSLFLFLPLPLPFLPPPFPPFPLSLFPFIFLLLYLLLSLPTLSIFLFLSLPSFSSFPFFSSTFSSLSTPLYFPPLSHFFLFSPPFLLSLSPPLSPSLPPFSPFHFSVIKCMT